MVGKGTPSFGKKNKKNHMLCRRCGRHSYHMTKKVCSACSFGKSKKLKHFAHQWKSVTRDRRLK
ncbi:MAG: 50S ribosomal protein L37e [Candidatus Aenigmarchaeota archaeon]|nr:50S ribosomal protein L37e [Candidatus Aenigmarchaeota archaeon]